MFEKYCGMERVIDGRRYAIDTRRVAVDRALLSHTPELVGDLLPAGGTLLLVCDSHTWQAAGDAVARAFIRAGRAVDRLLIVEPEDGSHAVADDANVAHIREALQAGGYVGAIAVGSGTVNDIAKLSTHQLGLPYVIVPTAPSMNGYTSGIAAILSEGLKTTVTCHVPVAVVCDVDVMAAAPYRMIASGLGDLLSRPVSNADWRLGARLDGAFYSTFPLELLDATRDALEGVPAGLPGRDPEAIRGLCDALLLSGMAMAAVGSSSPASGGEHLVSHYLDMVAIATGQRHDFHGCQVGVGTLTTSAFYERLRELEPEEIDVERLTARHLPWEAYARSLRERFAPYGLVDAVLPEAEAGYPDRPTLRTRLSVLREEWDDLITDVGRTLQTTEAIRAALVAAQAPHTFAEIGVGPEQARHAVLYAKDIRRRYTILDLASELNLLETWTDDVLAGNVLLGAGGDDEEDEG